MGYIEENLVVGERIIHKTGIHWIVLLGPITGASLLLLAAIALVVESIQSSSGTLGIVAAVMAAVGIITLGVSVERRNATEMAVTNKRVLIKTGILRKRTVELFLPKVESIAIDQGVLGRMFGYGTMTVRGTGGTAERFAMVRDPLEFRRQVHEQSERTERV